MDTILQETKRQLSNGPVMVHYDPKLSLHLAGRTSSYCA